MYPSERTIAHESQLIQPVMPGKQRLPPQQLRNDATDAPYIHCRGVITHTQEQLRCPIPPRDHCANATWPRHTHTQAVRCLCQQMHSLVSAVNLSAGEQSVQTCVSLSRRQTRGVTTRNPDWSRHARTILSEPLVLIDAPCEAKVANLQVTCRVEEQVRWLQVSVQHIRRVHVLESLENLVQKVLDMVVCERLWTGRWESAHAHTCPHAHVHEDENPHRTEITRIVY